MMSFVLLGYIYFMGNVLLVWTTLNNLMYPKPSHHPLPKIKMIGYTQLFFEPQLKMQLTTSSYKITSFLDFQPFLQGFQSVDKYINDLMTDINDPTYFQKLIAPFCDYKKHLFLLIIL